MANAAGGELLARETGREPGASVTGPAGVAETKRIAEEMAKRHPLWIVMFGDYSKQFVAFPRFTAPQGTILAARYPNALPPRLRAVENTTLPGRGARTAPGCPPVPTSEPNQERSGDAAPR